MDRSLEPFPPARSAAPVDAPDDDLDDASGDAPPIRPAALSVVIPVRDEAATLAPLLAQLQAAPQLVREVLVVDGGSRDGTRSIARLAGARLLRSPAGRGRQLQRGVAAATGPWLLLLHADVRLPPRWPEAVGRAMAPGSRGPGSWPPRAWYFRLAIEDAGPALRLVGLASNLRSRWRQRPYGDQGLLLPAPWLAACGGIRPLPLMEDLELVERLGGRGRLCDLGLPLRVSGRRWRQRGVWRTTLLNARLRRAWRQGASAEQLAALYYG